MTVLAAVKKHILCKRHYQKVGGAIDLAGLNEVFAELEGVSILGGNVAKKNTDRFSYWACEPVEVFEFGAGQRRPFEKLERALGKYKLSENSGNNPPKPIFCGGWIGYFSYELGRYIERLPETTLNDLRMPLIRLCFYDRLIAYDHVEENVWLAALEIDGDDERPQDKLAGLEQLLIKSQQAPVKPPAATDLETIDFSKIKCNMEKDFYLEAVAKIRRHIYDGDVYQVNFSQRFESDFTGRAAEVFHWQNEHNPSGQAAYIDSGDFHIVSASPEMFVTATDGVISTTPIKGTRRRTNNRLIDDENFRQLLESEKEQAELNMIIDLERNDIARICKPGTRGVVGGRTIESYPTVFHAVATVAGQLRDGISFSDILRAMFPGGSITGAPKVSSMKIIDDTEPTARGVYTGSIGFVGLDGNVRLNIAIRTIIIKGRKAYVQTGGGIVADSNAEAEWDETVVKALALLAGINSVQRAADSG